jgi:DNA-directed RNA polymerase subunit RPC12/RpoP
VAFICYFTVHQWIPATCTSPETCRFCGQTQGLPLGHSAAPADCSTPSICTRCGEELAPALGHEPSAATCTEPSVCTRCGQILEPALGHDWQEASYDRAETCSRCGKTRGKPLGWIGALRGDMGEEVLTLYGHGESCPYVLTEPVDRVFCLTVNLRIEDYSGDPFGTWGLYGQGPDGEWQLLGTFELTEAAYGTKLSFPIRLEGEYSLRALSMVAMTDADYTVDYAFSLTEAQQYID